MRRSLTALAAVALLAALLLAQAPALAAPAGPGGALPLSPTTPGAAATAAPGQQVVVVNSGPSMDQLKQEAPGLFQQVLGGLLGGVVAALRAALAGLYPDQATDGKRWFRVAFRLRDPPPPEDPRLF